MTTLIDPRERFVHRIAQFVLVTSSLASGLAALLYARHPDPRLLDLVLPAGFTLAMLLLCAYLQLRPHHLRGVIWAGYLAALFTIALPAWVYPIEAMLTPGLTLVDRLPPVTASVVPLILVMIVFVRLRQVLVASIVSWALVAGPILTYLAFHPDELVTPRGLEMAITLGPIMLLVLIFIPFHRGIERRLDALQGERARMTALAERDALTGLYNRRAGEGLIASLLEQPDGDDALMFFDIDYFKSINDQFGHAAGDEVLRQVARRCEAVLRRDDVFARWGGEEFLVLVRGARDDGVARVAEALRSVISATPIPPVGTVTASFGVARCRALDSALSWVQRADSALYAAKAAGRDRVVST